MSVTCAGGLPLRGLSQAATFKPDHQQVEAVLSVQQSNITGYTTVSSKRLNLGPVTRMFTFLHSLSPFPSGVPGAV